MSAALEAQNATPRSLGYRMPAEWEPHTATWIAWPHNASDWPGRFQPIPWVYAEIVRQLSAVEQVHILVQNADAEKRARGVLKRAQVNTSSVHFHQWPTNRVWTRDSGPIFVKSDNARRDHELEVQRVGEVSGLGAGQRAAGTSGGVAAAAVVYTWSHAGGRHTA